MYSAQVRGSINEWGTSRSQEPNKEKARCHAPPLLYSINVYIFSGGGTAPLLNFFFNYWRTLLGGTENKHAKILTEV